MKTIENKFEIGEECYTYYREKVSIPCPVCKGTKKIFYNGYEIECKQCNHNGQTLLGQTVVKPCKVKVTRIVANFWSNHTTVKYKVAPVDCYISVTNRAENSLFKTLEDAEQICREINTGNAGADF